MTDDEKTDKNRAMQADAMTIQGPVKRVHPGTANLKPVRAGDPPRNPAGRPAMPAPLRQEALRACPEALAVVLELLHDKKQSGNVRLGAATFVWDRALGRPEQAVTVTNEGSGPAIQPVDLVALLEALRAEQARREIVVNPSPIPAPVPEKP